jgi:hypothetical protein
MDLKQLFSNIKLLLNYEKKIIKKVIPVLDNEYIALDILEIYSVYKKIKNSKDYNNNEEKENEEKENEEYIDLEMGKGNVINDEKVLYFYNKV